jgi:hypothetical protein
MESTSPMAKLNWRALVVGVISNVGMLFVGACQENEILTCHLAGAFLAFGGGCVYALMQSLLTLKLHRETVHDAGISMGRVAGPSAVDGAVQDAGGGVNSGGMGTGNSGGGSGSGRDILALAGLHPNQYKLFRLRLLLSIITSLACFFTAAFGELSFERYTNGSEVNCTERYQHSKSGTEVGHFRGPWYPCMGGWVYHVLSAACEWTMATLFMVFFLTYTVEFRAINFSPEVGLIAGKHVEGNTLLQPLRIQTTERNDHTAGIYE